MKKNNNSDKETDDLDFNGVKNFLEAEENINDFLDGNNTPLIIKPFIDLWLKKSNEKKCFDVIKSLLENGENPNTKDKFGFTALHYAAGESLQLSKLLLDWDADVNTTNIENEAPLYIAASHGLSKHKKITKLLLNYGADTDITSIYGYKIIFQATATGNFQIMRMLLQKDSSGVNLCNKKEGNTALHISVMNPPYPYKNTELLLKYGADIHAENFEGITPFQIVCKYASPIYLKLKKLFLRYNTPCLKY